MLESLKKSKSLKIKRVLLLGAQYNKNPITSVSEEIRSIRKIISATDSHVHNELYVNKSVIIDVLQKSANEIDILHFATHMSHETIQSDEESIYIERIIDILRQWTSKPVLVFLNGCNSDKYAKELTNIGVTYVVATNGWINDNLASEISTSFYKNLISGLPVRRALEASYYSLMLDHAPHENQRSIDLEYEDQDLSSNWIIYSDTSVPTKLIFKFVAKERIKKSAILVTFLSLVVLTSWFAWHTANKPIVKMTHRPFDNEVQLGYILNNISEEQISYCTPLYTFFSKFIGDSCMKIDLSTNEASSGVPDIQACHKDTIHLNTPPLKALDKIMDSFSHCLQRSKVSNSFKIIVNEENVVSRPNHDGRMFLFCNCK